MQLGQRWARTWFAVGPGSPPLSGLGSGSWTLSGWLHYALHDFVCSIISTDLSVLHRRSPCLHAASCINRWEIFSREILSSDPTPEFFFLPSPPPRPGRDLVRVRSPGTPLPSLSLPPRLVLSTAFMCSCSAASSACSKPWGCSISWLPLGALLLLPALLRPHCWSETEAKRIRI